MAASVRDDEIIIAGINVTPLVDITLILLVTLMVTASCMVARTIPMELPRLVTGESAAPMLSVHLSVRGSVR
jgi:biopolymer transport protein ExbD